MRKFKYKNNQRLYYSILFFLIISSIAAFNALFPYLHLSWWINILEVVLLASMFKFAINKREPLYSAYFWILIIGFIFHLFMRELPFNRNLWEVMRWITILYLLCIAKKQDNSCFYRIAIICFILECGLAIYERITLSRIIEYTSSMFESTVMYGEQDESFFRSCAFLGHPLDNANIISLFMGFILVNRKLKKQYKIALLLVGLGALWAFNSRAAILIWIIIITYRMIFYEQKIIYVLIGLIVFFMVSPYILDVINSGILGRFTFDNLIDESSLTRLSSFYFFMNQDWSISSVLMGGKLLYMPGTKLLLENGVLLNLGYWGWIIGLLKIVIEISLTYKLLSLYTNQEKFIVMLSFWGVGLMNNNTFNSLCLTFFLFTYVSFYCNESMLIVNKIFPKKNLE